MATLREELEALEAWANDRAHYEDGHIRPLAACDGEKLLALASLCRRAVEVAEELATGVSDVTEIANGVLDAKDAEIARLRAEVERLRPYISPEGDPGIEAWARCYKKQGDWLRDARADAQKGRELLAAATEWLTLALQSGAHRHLVDLREQVPGADINAFRAYLQPGWISPTGKGE